jgi:RNA polymerase subunit RPABC4/transcription elongation factor Spt4
MGQLLNANCLCGYQDEIAIGSLRSNYRSVCRFPFSCYDCSEIFNGDLYVHRNRCPTCSGAKTTSYEDPTLFQESEGAHKAASWNINIWFTLEEDYFPAQRTLFKSIKRFFKSNSRVLPVSREAVLMNKGYRCPACSSHGLCFDLSGMVD